MAISGAAWTDGLLSIAPPFVNCTVACTSLQNDVILTPWSVRGLERVMTAQPPLAAIGQQTSVQSTQVCTQSETGSDPSVPGSVENGRRHDAAAVPESHREYLLDLRAS
jgi:hypothetical protein